MGSELSTILSRTPPFHFVALGAGRLNRFFSVPQFLYSNSSNLSKTYTTNTESSVRVRNRSNDARKIKKADRNKNQGWLGRQCIAHPQVIILLSCAHKFHSRQITHVPIIRNVNIPVHCSCVPACHCNSPAAASERLLNILNSEKAAATPKALTPYRPG
eukprot:g83207.t1